MDIPIGVANSVSANFQFDPLDTLNYAKQENFKTIQIYLNSQLIAKEKTLKEIKKEQSSFTHIYYHAEGAFSKEFIGSDYRKNLYAFLKDVESPNYIIHFDERDSIDKIIKLAESLSDEVPHIYVENYFQFEGKEEAEKNLKKYQAMFTLSSNFGTNLFPVLDIPRLFHEKLNFNMDEALDWCYQLLNFFGNRQIPLLLHLIDSADANQSHRNFCAVGEGYIPYQKIFNFILKTRPHISGIILEFEDKITPLQSREYIRSVIEEG